MAKINPDFDYNPVEAKLDSEFDQIATGIWLNFDRNQSNFDSPTSFDAVFDWTGVSYHQIVASVEDKSKQRSRGEIDLTIYLIRKWFDWIDWSNHYDQTILSIELVQPDWFT